MTLEAMKMNTVIYAPANGTVTSFAVAAGDTVAENQTLAYLG
jgi:biotin carboxyl carrier protein